MSYVVIPTPKNSPGFILNSFSMSAQGSISVTSVSPSAGTGATEANNNFSIIRANSVTQKDVVKSAKMEKHSMLGFTYEARPNIEVLDNDPYCYRVCFNVSLVKREDKGDNLVDIYEAKGKVTCPEFTMEEYLCLCKKHLLWGLVSNALRVKIFEFSIQPIRWVFKLPETLAGLDPTNELYKDKVRLAFGSFIRGKSDIYQNVKQAIKSFYGEIDEIIKETVTKLTKKNDDNGDVKCAGIKDALLLKKEFGVYSREYTSDIFDYLFADKYAFYNGDEVRIDNGCMLIPNFWVKTSEIEILSNKYIGYGARTSIIDWGTEPYPWALFRTNMIWNNLDALIRKKVSFTKEKSKQGVVGREVYIAGLKNGKMSFKKLSEKYFGISEDRIDLISSLAIGELEGVSE